MRLVKVIWFAVACQAFGIYMYKIDFIFYACEQYHSFWRAQLQIYLLLLVVEKERLAFACLSTTRTLDRITTSWLYVV